MNNELLQAFGPLEVAHTPSKPSKWRMRVKLAVRKEGIGLFSKGSHKLKDATCDPAHHPSIRPIVEHIKEQNYAPYQEDSGAGDLRYVQITVNPETEMAQVAFACQRPLDLPPHPLIESYWYNINTSRTNTIFSKAWHHGWGPRLQRLRFCGLQFDFHPAAFVQANMEVFERLVYDVADRVPKGASVVEYYAGVGVMGSVLANNGHSVTCIEVNPHCDTNVQPGVARVFSPAEEHIVDADVSLFDPPRKGLDVKPLYMVSSPLIFYVSCNPKTFTRDALALHDRGYKLKELRSYDFFPNTGHIELLGCFELTNT